MIEKIEKEEPGFHEVEVGRDIELDPNYSLEDKEKFEEESGHGLSIRFEGGKLIGRILRYIFVPKK